jgi:polyhydroxyalkanoate synthesis repressor PhaR
MSEEQLVRVIKKYPNRRLYDTKLSKYITLADVKQLVMDKIPFCIQDAKSEEDLTRSILLQIIMEQEEGGDPIFSSHVLEQLIRFYDGSLQHMVGSYLEQSFKLLSQQQERFNAQLNTMMEKNPLFYMGGMAEHNLRLWREMQESFFKAAMGGLMTPPGEKEDKPQDKD